MASLRMNDATKVSSATAAIVISLLIGALASDISLCSSTVYIDGKAEPFHVERVDEIESAVDEFCRRKVISKSDCERISENHRRHCFRALQPHQSEQNDHASLASTDSTTENAADMTARQYTKIDYSSKSGPILRVTAGTETHNLQAYLGETEEQTVLRFCGTLKLDLSQCSQVATTYSELLAKGNSAGSSGGSMSSQDENPVSSPNDSDIGKNDYVAREGDSANDRVSVDGEGVRREKVPTRTSREYYDTPRGRETSALSIESAVALLQELLRGAFAVSISSSVATVQNFLSSYWRWIMLGAGILYAYVVHHAQEEERRW
jgi:hypothetical protein